LPQITKLKAQKNQKRVNVFVDHKFSFGLSLNEAVKLGLFVGQKSSDQEIEKLFFKSQLEKFYQKTLNFLSFRPRSEKEINDYIQKKLFKSSAGVDELKKKIKDKIINKLKKQMLIDDYKFACWWLEQRLAFRPKGKKMLYLELRQKGVVQDIIEKTLAQLPDYKFEDLASALVDKKIRLYEKLPLFKQKQKLFEFLQRRGFEYSIIKKVIDEKLKKG